MELKIVEHMKFDELVMVDKVLGLGEMTLATSRKPYCILCTGNYYEPNCKQVLETLSTKGVAKCVKSWKRDNCIDDPYGRPYKVGTIDCSIWDLRRYFGITEPLENFLDYETNAFLKGETNTLIY